MESNTVEYWLNKAKEEGKEWADAALENAKAQDGLEYTATSILDALFRGFDWEITPMHEGLDFWSDIYDKLNK